MHSVAGKMQGSRMEGGVDGGHCREALPWLPFASAGAAAPSHRALHQSHHIRKSEGRKKKKREE